MTTFKSDAQGFLVGELVETNRDILRSQQQGMAVWKAIRTDVKAIAGMVSAQVATASRASNSSARGARGPYGPRAVATPAGRASRGDSGRAPSAPSGRSSAASNASRSTASASVPAQRASNGRFVAGAKRDSGDAAGALARSSNGRFVAGQSRDGSGATGAGGLGRLSDSIGKLVGTLNTADNVDPTLNAVKEITDVVTPLGRGLFSLFGRSAERKKERWYQRFWKALTSPVGARTGPAAAPKAGGMMNGMMLAAGGMLKNVPAMLMMVFSRILMPIAALWGAFELGQWVGKKIYEWLDSSGLMAKAFDAFDSIGAAFSNAWSSVTGGIDTVVKGISTAWKDTTDAFTGAIKSFMTFPAKIGEVLNGIDSALRKLPIIGDIYGKAADAIKNTAADARTGYKEGVSGAAVPPAATAAQALGRDVGKVAGTVKAVGAQAGAGYDEARGIPTTASAPQGMAQKVARGAGGAAGWVLGQTSKSYESGRGGAGTVSSGAGDNGGASYGTYQLSSKMGTLSKFLKQSQYGDQFAGLTPGSPEFNSKWKEIAKNDPSFGGAQHDFMKATHFDPAMKALQDAGIDLSKHGPAVQDALWSTATQFGPGSMKNRDGAVGIFSKVLAGKNTSSMSQSEIVAAIQDYKAANNSTLFAKSSGVVRAGTLARAGNEKDSLLKLAANSPTIPSGSVPKIAGVSETSMPGMPSANVPSSVPMTLPPLPETPAFPVKLNSDAGAGRGIVNFTLPDQIGQNIGDRGIAHIVTGGMGMVA